MSEESPKLGYAYRRSAIGLGIVAVGWTQIGRAHV